MNFAASMLNTMPYFDGNNKLLLSPSDFITPWKFGSQSVQDIPATKLKSLEEAKQILTVRQVNMRKIKKEEMATELSRFKQGYLKWGKTRN